MAAVVQAPLAARAARAIGRRRIVVVSDRYPPRTHGGAELSLHTLLSELDRKHDVVVVTFDDQRSFPHSYAIDGVQVLAIPGQKKWPMHRSGPDAALESLPAPLRKPALRVLGSSGVGPEERADDRLLQRAARAEPTGGVVSDFVELPHGVAVPTLRSILRTCRPELVHADNYRSIVTTALASRGLPLRRVGLVRDNRFHCVRHSQSVSIDGQICAQCALQCAGVDLPDDPGLQQRVLERSRSFRQECLQSFDRVVVTSDYLRRAVTQIVPTERVVRVANAPEEPEVVADYVRGVGELPGTNLLVVGMLNESKGQLQLVRQLSRLAERVPDVVLHLAGRGARIERRIREIAAEKGVSERLVLHGYVDRPRLYALYRQCQIVVLPTLWPEPFGRIPLEAGLARRPVIAFAVGGLKEQIVHGETGFLVRPNDHAALVDAIGLLADNPEKQLYMGERRYEHVVRTCRAALLRGSLSRVWGELIDGGAH